MKSNLLIVLLSGIFSVVCLIINIQYVAGSTGDKLSSFGLGMGCAIFVITLLSWIYKYRKQKAV
jgi:hypothetical protein